MQPSLIFGLVVLVIAAVTINQLTRVERRPGHKGPWNRARYFAGFLVIAAMLGGTLVRQRMAWRDLSGLMVPLPPGAEHLVGWPPWSPTDRTWLIRYHGTFEDARRFYSVVAAERGYRMEGNSDGPQLLLLRGDTTIHVAVSGDNDDALLVSLRTGSAPR